MSSKTPNFNLTKPSADDFYDIDVHNGNMDIVDAELKKLNDGKAPSGHGLGTFPKPYTRTEFKSVMRYGSGFYQVDTAADSPITSTAWKAMVQLASNITPGLESGGQLLMLIDDITTPKLWYRNMASGVTSEWVEMLHTGNIAKLTPFKIKSGTYVGNGNYSSSPSTLTFDADFKPQIVLLLGDGTEDSRIYFCARPRTRGYCMYTDGTSTHKITLTWGENALSWSGNSASNQNNTSGVTYHYIAIGG